MDRAVGLGTDCDGLRGPYKEVFGFLCLLFQALPLLQATVEVEDVGPQVGQQLAYSCYLSNSAICFLSPNNNLMLLALHTDLGLTPLWRKYCHVGTTQWKLAVVKSVLSWQKVTVLRRNDLKALIVKHQLFWYLQKFCAVYCDWCEKNQYMGKVCFDQHKLNLSISPLYFLFPAFPIYYISLHIQGLRIPQQ